MCDCVRGQTEVLHLLTNEVLCQLTADLRRPNTSLTPWLIQRSSGWRALCMLVCSCCCCCSDFSLASLKRFVISNLILKRRFSLCLLLIILLCIHAAMLFTCEHGSSLNNTTNSSAANPSVILVTLLFVCQLFWFNASIQRWDNIRGTRVKSLYIVKLLSGPTVKLKSRQTSLSCDCSPTLWKKIDDK